MTLAPPILPQLALHESEVTIVKLSSLNDTLKILVPDSGDFEANWDVYPILGADPDLPDWKGCKAPTGVWDDAVDDMVKLSGIELLIPKAVLEKYSDSAVDLRYKFADESSLEPYSERLKLYVEA
ncbi:hypothetical protein ACYZTL_11495 [Pseudomonas sp. LB3P81]